MTQTRLGMIGAGFIADRHIGKLALMDDVKIVAVADPSEERARQQAARCGAAPYADFRHMLDREQLDALYICVPPFAHGDPERAALERGLPFFVEKPLATDYDSAAALSREIDAKELVTAVGYHWRYLDTTERAQEMLADRPARLALGYWLDFTPPPAWWGKEAESGGQMVEQTTHIFDMARLLTRRCHAGICRRVASSAVGLSRGRCLGCLSRHPAFCFRRSWHDGIYLPLKLAAPGWSPPVQRGHGD